MSKRKGPGRYGLKYLPDALNRKENIAMFRTGMYVGGMKQAGDFNGASAFVMLLTNNMWGIVACGDKGFDYARENPDKVFVYPTLKSAVLAYKLGVRGEVNAKPK